MHVFGDGEAKINLKGVDGAPNLVWAVDMSRNEIRRAMKLVNDMQKELLAKWKEIHG